MNDDYGSRFEADALAPYLNEIENFLDDKGRLIRYPAKQRKQIFALFYLSSKFESGCRYTEKEVNHILNDWHNIILRVMFEKNPRINAGLLVEKYAGCLLVDAAI